MAKYTEWVIECLTKRGKPYRRAVFQGWKQGSRVGLARAASWEWKDAAKSAMYKTQGRLRKLIITRIETMELEP